MTMPGAELHRAESHRAQRIPGSGKADCGIHSSTTPLTTDPHQTWPPQPQAPQNPDFVLYPAQDLNMSRWPQPPSVRRSALTFSPDSIGTVSPQDTLLDYTPSSAAYSNFTTPEDSFLQTPEIDYLDSSLYDAGPPPDLFPSLDPETGVPTTYPQFARPEPEEQSFKPPASPALSLAAPTMKRTTSNGQPTSRGSQQGRTGARVSKRRTHPLPPIEVDYDDAAGIKRARNTMAARKSRERRQQNLEDLETKVFEQQARIEELENFKARAIASGYIDIP